MNALQLLAQYGARPAAAGGGGAVQYIGTSTQTASSTTVTINVPTGAQAGDTLVVIVNFNVLNPSTDGFSDLAGFNLVDLSAVATSRAQAILWRTLAASPPASYTATLTTDPSGKRATSVLLRGADPTTPIHDWSVQTQLAAAGSSITSLPVVVPAGALVIASSRQTTTSTITLDAALTSIGSSNNSPTNVTFHCGYEEDATPGAARTYANTHSSTARDKIMHAVVIR